MEQQANMFKALSDVNRIKIMDLLIKGESCSCELINELPITQPTLSYHLKLLHDAGLITSVKEGNRVNHRVKKEVDAFTARTSSARATSSPSTW